MRFVIIPLRLATVAIPAILAVLAGSTAQANDEEWLAGTWTLPAAGAQSPAGTTIAFFPRYKFLGLEWTTPGGSGREYTVKLNTRVAPRRINLTPNTANAAPLLGIYQLAGNQLRLRMAPAGMARPANFAAPLRAGEENLAFKFQPVPAAWKHVSLGTGTGVDVYEKPVTWSSGKHEKHYVTVVDLTKATIRNMAGSKVKTIDAPIDTHYPYQYWNAALAGNTATRKLKVMVNGGFFTGREPGPLQLDHGLKKGGTIWSYGVKNTAVASRVPHLRALITGNSWARIGKHSRAVFNDPRNPDVVGGIGTGWAVPGIGGRNYIAVRDANRDGVYESLLLFTATRARQNHGVIALNRFGVSEKKIMMLDGGQSVRLIVDRNYKVVPSKKIARLIRQHPHMIAIYMGK